MSVAAFRVHIKYVLPCLSRQGWVVRVSGKGGCPHVVKLGWTLLLRLRFVQVVFGPIVRCESALSSFLVSSLVSVTGVCGVDAERTIPIVSFGCLMPAIRWLVAFARFAVVFPLGGP